MEAVISLIYDDERYAEAIEKAISPDNLSAPSNLNINTVKIASKVITRLECVNRIETLIATIDDLLMAVQIAERVLSTSLFFLSSTKNGD